MTGDFIDDEQDPGPLTMRQQQILRVIREWVDRHGYPPTVREIAAKIGVSSPSTVAHHLTAMQQRGVIRRDAERPRAVDARAGLAGTPSPPAPVFVPLIGTIAAGRPLLAEEAIEDVLPLPQEIVGHGTLFALRVRGDSMIDAAICDGDTVVVRQQPTADNGDIVAAMIDGEATVKVYRNLNDAVQLLPRNSSYAPITANDAVVLGKVVAVLRHT
ncbi:transcriptional repressor LexA [Catellatospora methionotrophica]|uniref:transcriptional repressor LexA n=1 Tax=Catellatospora methionotrophica TaxID=121620 RepID=UPI003F4D0369